MAVSCDMRFLLLSRDGSGGSEFNGYHHSINGDPSISTMGPDDDINCHNWDSIELNVNRLFTTYVTLHSVCLIRDRL